MGRNPLPLLIGLGAIVCLIVAGQNPKAATPEKPVAVAPHPAAPKKPDVIVLIDFGGPWCSVCRKMEPTVKQLESDGVKVEKIDPQEDTDAASKWDIHDCPTFVATRNGKEIGRHVGACSINELRKLVGKPIAKSDDETPKPAPASKPAPLTPDPDDPARGPEGWRLRLFYPRGSASGELLKTQISGMKAIAAKYGFDSGTTDGELFDYWRKQLSSKKVTLILVHPDGRIVYQESQRIPIDPIKLREELRDAARRSWKGAK